MFLTAKPKKKWYMFYNGALMLDDWQKLFLDSFTQEEYCELVKEYYPEESSGYLKIRDSIELFMNDERFKEVK